MKTLIVALLVLVATSAFADWNTSYRLGNEPIMDATSEFLLGTGWNTSVRYGLWQVGIKDPIKQDGLAFVSGFAENAIAVNCFPNDGRHGNYSFHYRLWKDAGFFCEAENFLKFGEDMMALQMRQNGKSYKSIRNARWIYRGVVGALATGAFFITLNKNTNHEP